MTSLAEDALASAERWQKQAPSEDDKIDFLTKSIDDMKNPDVQDEFKGNIKKLGVAAVQTDEAFDKINRTFIKFVKDHGSDFPGLATYKDRWTTYKDCWTTLLRQSRDLANLTSANYKKYDQVFLHIVQNVRDKKEMVEAAEALSTFSEEKPVGIPLDISQKFLDLKNDVERFQKEFNDYVETQRVQLLAQAKNLQQEIDGLLKQIDGLTAAIMAAITLIGVGAWWNLVISAIAGIAIIGLAVERAKKQKQLAAKQADLAEVNRKQEALAHIKSEFDGLDPDIKIISSSLSLFADIWRQFHGEAEEFAKVLRDVQSPTSIPRAFRLRVELARTIASPLQLALEAYANTIGTR